MPPIQLTDNIQVKCLKAGVANIILSQAMVGALVLLEDRTELEHLPVLYHLPGALLQPHDLGGRVGLGGAGQRDGANIVLQNLTLSTGYAD